MMTSSPRERLSRNAWLTSTMPTGKVRRQIIGSLFGILQRCRHPSLVERSSGRPQTAVPGASEGRTDVGLIARGSIEAAVPHAELGGTTPTDRDDEVNEAA